MTQVELSHRYGLHRFLRHGQYIGPVRIADHAEGWMSTARLPCWICDEVEVARTWGPGRSFWRAVSARRISQQPASKTSVRSLPCIYSTLFGSTRHQDGSCSSLHQMKL